MKKILIFLPIIYIFVVWFIFSSPYFLKNKVPYPSTYQVDHFHPWSAYLELKGPVKNGAMPDIIDQIYPWRYFTIAAWKSMQVPFWNPNSFAGNPHLANYQSAVLSPFNLLFFILPFIDAWSLLILLQPLIAGIGMYIFVREVKVSKIGALLSAVVFMFCGFIVVWMAYGTLSLSISFLPISFFLIHKYINTKQKRYLFFLSLIIPLSFFSGHFQTSLYFLGVIIAFVLFNGIIRRENLHFVYHMLIAVAAGVIFSLPQLLPSIEFYRYSVRNDIFIQGGGMPLFYLITSVAPDFFGNPVTRNDWIGSYAEWASFVGITAFFLALVSLTKRRLLTIFFMVLAVVSLIIAVDSPIQSFIGMLKIPVISTSAPARVIVIFSFSIAVLAGFGLDELKSILDKKEIKKLLYPLLFVSLFFFGVWMWLLLFKPFSPEKMHIAQRNFILPTSLFFGSVVMVFLTLVKKRFLLLLVYYMLLVASFDSFRFAQKWMPFDSKNFVFSDLPVITEMQKEIGYGRIFGNIGAQVGTYYNLPLIEGYDPLYIKRYGEFLSSSADGQFVQAERSVAKISRDGKYINRVLDLLAVQILYHPISDTNQEWAYPVWKDVDRFKLLYKDDKFQLFKNSYALGHAHLFYNHEVIKDDREIIKRFYSPDFDFRKKLIVEEEIGGLVNEGSGSAKIVLYSPNKVVIETITDMPALLFLSDNFYPGWKATVNGVMEKIYRADYTFRAVVVPAGRSRVEFIYESWNL